MSKLQQAQKYVEENRNKVNPEFRLKYHMMPEIGWMNDPNGFIYYKGEYHLFYQYYPYDSKWGTPYWGHAKSKDLIIWEHMPIALAPDMYYDVDGCFSGSAIEVDGKLYLMYTGHTNPDPDNPKNIRQVQNMAVSKDGVNFEKIKQNPVISERDLPYIALPQDFRDPMIFKHNDSYYAVIASRNIDGSGQLLLYKSNNLLNWNYVGVIIRSDNKLGKMWECPSLFKLNDMDVLILSVQHLDKNGDKYHNLFSSIYMLGKMDYESWKFICEVVDEIDYGFDFYAPQTLVDDRGRRIMIAWMQVWGRTIPTDCHGHNWAGAMTLPRELRVIDGKLYQIPVDEITKYRKNKISYKDIIVNDKIQLDGIEGQNVELEVEIDAQNANNFGIKVLKGEKEETVMHYDRREGKFIFDRSKSGEQIKNTEGKEDNEQIRKTTVSLKNNILSLRIFIDRCSVEVFIQNGERVMTSTVYPKSTSKSIEFFTDNKIIIKNLNKWDIELGGIK
ncbi:glycoside hydrolase family 32 protein [Anaerocellum diazotrophicum]|uniref:Sucrose-6-phosphate hydrolase n=1 Tax=Caldicellulosiruptor diazotrophicus TaxID=2806205 RepID=A0ABN6EEJ2_9FIRM|nr:glycoside hydrolase family 32 protein [Caldicellulosiruptor diazotrophicus]BCS82174.1 glycosyl hydrolase [Caldicellulosiruptor diazotrophicus]